MSKHQPTRQEIIEYASDLLYPASTLYSRDKEPSYLWERAVEKAIERAIEDLSYEEEDL